ncbi:MAG TPA: hypothetical protein PKA63_05315 [Oligoflexia bacterium]|nr:hypothetical protein [Oligoflexia bacterium]HMP48067.1 hypothetical protein [Oligoflexia bacterium]
MGLLPNMPEHRDGPLTISRGIFGTSFPENAMCFWGRKGLRNTRYKEKNKKVFLRSISSILKARFLKKPFGNAPLVLKADID